MSHHRIEFARQITIGEFYPDRLYSSVGVSELSYSVSKFYFAPLREYFEIGGFKELLRHKRTLDLTEAADYLKPFLARCGPLDLTPDALVKTCDSSRHSNVIAHITSQANPSELCPQLIRDWVRCTTRWLCTQCTPGSVLADDHSRCISKAKYYALTAVMDRIRPGMLKILECVSGLTLDRSRNKCVETIPNCVQPGSFGRCSRCAINFRLNQSRTRCIKCVAHCLECLFGDTCERCARGYHLTRNISNLSLSNRRNCHSRVCSLSGHLCHLPIGFFLHVVRTGLHFVEKKHSDTALYENLRTRT